MRLKRQHKWMIGLAILFLLVNIILIYVDKDQKIAQTTHIKTWTKVTEQDMYESLDTKGVLDYSDESFVYFDESKGEFKEFLVAEGQEVSAGEALYSYEMDNYYETASQLESESEKISDEMSAIEGAIAHMSSYPIGTSSSSQIPTDELQDGQESTELLQYIQTMNESQSNEQAELFKEQYITEKEKELAVKQAEYTSVEAQLTELTTEGNTITVESPYDGVVASLSETLTDPLMTIKSDELIVRSELTEKEHANVAPELDVNVTMKENNKVKEGVVESVDTFPEEISIKGESKYPFIVHFNTEDEEDIDLEDEEDLDFNQNQVEKTDDEVGALSPGYHAALEIITAESLDAPVINSRVLHGHSLWQMTTKGTLVKVPVETGIHMDEMVEIEKGIERSDWIARQPNERFSTHTPFITSLDITSINRNSLQSNRWFQDLMIGLLSR